ncbi:MAG: NUDIX hydrolase [Parachlamydiales bacterium]|jgi:ADP-ribose pyrophosphatase
MSKAEAQLKKERLAKSQRKTIFQGKILNLHLEKLFFKGGKTKEKEIVEHPGAVVCLPVNAAKKIFLIKQYRRAVDSILIELPAGRIEKNEKPLFAAQRELREETGYKAAQLIRLGGFLTTPGFSNEFLHLFLALGLKKSPLAPDADEKLDLMEASLEEALQMVQTGLIQDAKTISALLYYLLWQTGSKPLSALKNRLFEKTELPRPASGLK